MIKLYRSSHAIEAQAIVDQLKLNNIEACLLNNYLAGALGDIPFLETGPEIWIEQESDLAQAQEIVKLYFKNLQAQSAEPELFCPKCNESNPGNFDFCWACGSALKED